MFFILFVFVVLYVFYVFHTTRNKAIQLIKHGNPEEALRLLELTTLSRNEKQK